MCTHWEALVFVTVGFAAVQALAMDTGEEFMTCPADSSHLKDLGISFFQHRGTVKRRDEGLFLIDDGGDLLSKRASKSNAKKQIFNLFRSSLFNQSLDFESQKHWEKHPHRHAHEHATCFGSPSAKLTIVTLVAGFPDEYVSALIRNRLKLAKFGDYEYCQYNHTLDHRRNAAWSKVLAILALLEQGRQQVVWMDADAVMARQRRFEEFINATKDLTFTNDFDENVDVEPWSSINTGVVLTQNSPWAKRFWRDIYDKFPEAVDDKWWDQRAVLRYRELYPEEFDAHANIISYTLMNYPLRYIDWDDGSAFIVHAAGVGGEHNGGASKYNELLQKYLS